MATPSLRDLDDSPTRHTGPPPTGHTGPPPTRRAGLTRDDVVDAALGLVEAEGADGLTMRRLAARLGVTTTTIYWHVGNRDELVVALIRRLAERQGGSEIHGDTPAERIVDAAGNIWRNALAHRNVTALARRVGATTLLELPLEVALLAELEAAGLHGEHARDALRSILMVVAGFLVGAWRPPAEVADELSPSALWETVEDPRIRAETLAAVARPPDTAALFDTTVRSVVAGLLSGPRELPDPPARIRGRNP